MQEILSFAILLAIWAVYWYAWSKIEKQIGKWIFPWLRPLLARLFPIFNFTPWLFEPVEGSDIPDKQRRFFARHSPAFLARRYTHLGDFVLRRDREPSCCRYFLSPDGKIIAALSCYLGSQTIDCMSVLLDGMYLETCNISTSQLPPKKDGLQFFTIRADDPAHVIDHHQACMDKVAAEGNTEPAPLTAADLQAVSNYGRELSLRSLHHQGVLGELPEFLRLKQPAALPA